MAAVAWPDPRRAPQFPTLGAAIAQLDSDKTERVLEALMAIRKRFIKVLLVFVVQSPFLSRSICASRKPNRRAQTHS